MSVPLCQLLVPLVQPAARVLSHGRHAACCVTAPAVRGVRSSRRRCVRVAAAAGEPPSKADGTTPRGHSSAPAASPTAGDSTREGYYDRLLKLEADPVAGRDAANVSSNLKLAGLVVILLAGLTAGFLASNGLL